MSEIVPFIPARRPTEVLYRPIISAPRLTTKLPEIEPKEIIEREKPPVNSPTKYREERAFPRRLSPPKYPSLPGNNVSKRRPIRFDDVPRQSQQQQPTTNDEHKVMDMIRQELNERPLNPNEELLIVEQ